MINRLIVFGSHDRKSTNMLLSKNHGEPCWAPRWEILQKYICNEQVSSKTSGKWWAHLDSNQGPTGYEPGALPAELWAPYHTVNFNFIVVIVFSQQARGPKIHRVFLLRLIWEVFGPQMVQKCCLPSVRTGLGNSSKLLVGSFFNLEPFFKRTSPWAYVRPP